MACVITVKSLPPLVCSEEVDDVRRQLAEVAEGKRFLLQGGDCAERFADCNSSLIENKLRILLQVSSRAIAASGRLKRRCLQQDARAPASAPRGPIHPTPLLDTDVPGPHLGRPHAHAAHRPHGRPVLQAALRGHGDCGGR